MTASILVHALAILVAAAEGHGLRIDRHDGVGCPCGDTAWGGAQNRRPHQTGSLPLRMPILSIVEQPKDGPATFPPILQPQCPPALADRPATPDFRLLREFPLVWSPSFASDPTVCAYIDRRGRITKAYVLEGSGSRGTDERAVEALGMLDFVPASSADGPTAAWHRIVIHLRVTEQPLIW